MRSVEVEMKVILSVSGAVIGSENLHVTVFTIFI